jgi:hypothetical protein
MEKQTEIPAEIAKKYTDLKAAKDKEVQEQKYALAGQLRDKLRNLVEEKSFFKCVIKSRTYGF